MFRSNGITQTDNILEINFPFYCPPSWIHIILLSITQLSGEYNSIKNLEIIVIITKHANFLKNRCQKAVAMETSLLANKGR